MQFFICFFPALNLPLKFRLSLFFFYFMGMMFVENYVKLKSCRLHIPGSGGGHVMVHLQVCRAATGFD